MAVEVAFAVFELDKDVGNALARDGLDVVEVAEVAERAFELPRDSLFDVARAHSGIDDDDRDVGQVYGRQQVDFELEKREHAAGEDGDGHHAEQDRPPHDEVEHSTAERRRFDLSVSASQRSHPSQENGDR